MQTYGIGGTEVKGDASEAISEIQQNRTLLIEKLSAEPPVKPEVVQGLTKIDEVFDHFKPQLGVEFQDSEGVSRQETLRFGNLADIGCNFFPELFYIFFFSFLRFHMTVYYDSKNSCYLSRSKILYTC